MSKFQSTKLIELGSVAFRQWRATSHCKFVHGYRLMAKIWFGCSELDENGWVVDFGSLKPITDMLQGHYDHSLCIAFDDPAIDDFLALSEKGIVALKCMEGVGIEKFAKHVHVLVDIVIADKTDGRCWVEKVEVFEHEKNSAIYIDYSPVTVEYSDESIEVSSPGKQPKTEPVTPQPHVPRPASVGNNITSGKGGWFEGTTWESNK